MYKKRVYSLCFFLFIGSAGAASAASPTYGASAAVMTEVDTITEAWDCASPSLVPPSRCYFGDVQGNGSVAGDSLPAAGVATSLTHPAPEYNDPVNASRILWVGELAGDGSSGPGSTYTQSLGDRFVIFETPNTHDGRRGIGNTVTLLNDTPHPDDGGRWKVGGFIHDLDMNMWLIASVNTHPTADQNSLKDIVFTIGESFNGYSGYSWRPIVHFSMNPLDRQASDDYGVRWHLGGGGADFVKDPNNSDRWIGVMSWTNLDGSGPLRGAAPAMIDFSQEDNPTIGIQLCLGFQDGLDMSDPRARQGFSSQYDFYCYREAEKGTWYTSTTEVTARPTRAGGGEALPARLSSDFVRNTALVRTSYGTHGEIWSASYNVDTKWCSDASNRALLNYSSENECALARNFCGQYLNSSQYLANRANLLGGTTEKLRYAEWDLNTLWKVGADKFLDNELRGLFDSTLGWPSPEGDHGAMYVAGIRYDWDEAGKEALYVTVKRSLCFEPWNWGNQRWYGTGTAYLNLVEK